MGGVVSGGIDNDELIDNLLNANYISTPMVERAFRAVDRGEYYLPEYRKNAYKDLAWQRGRLHISAPCIYAKALEGLQVEPGMSFLNLGSGTGYLSTIVGLLLGSRGVNHGVELYDEVIEYANKKLEDFKRHSGAIDEFEFCEPKFMIGNALSLGAEFMGAYDRVYCGADVPQHLYRYMQSLLKIGGTVVFPIRGELVRVHRRTFNHWDSAPLLDVTFAELVVPQENGECVKLVENQPLSLQALCRTTIRNLIRNNVEIIQPYKRSRLNQPPEEDTPKNQTDPSFRYVPINLPYPERDHRSSDDDDLYWPCQIHAEHIAAVSTTSSDSVPGSSDEEVESDMSDISDELSKSIRVHIHECPDIFEKFHKVELVRVSCNTDDKYSSSVCKECNIQPTKIDMNKMRMYQSSYTPPMQERIQQLPLPFILRKYLNYYRDFDVKQEPSE